MPYIKQEARDIFDPILECIGKAPNISAHQVHSVFMNMKKEDIDGAVNYIITKLVMNKEKISEKIKEFINIMIVDQYVTNLNYFKINAFTGLIDNVLDNLYERNWETEENVIFLCELLVEYKEKYVREYEDFKMTENGDLI